MSRDSYGHLDKSSVHVIQTERLVLRRLCASDAEYLLPILSNPESMQWLSDTGLRKTIEAVQEWIDERLARPGCDNFLVDLVPATPSLVNESYTQSTVSGEQSLREVIGVLGSPDVPRVGYIFHPSYYGKGYATEALKAYIESYWKRLIPGSFDFASAATDVENLPSRRLLEKSGFVLQRIEKQAHNNPFKGGWRDDAIYLITRPGTSTSQAGISGQNYENVEDETSKLAN